MLAPSLTKSCLYQTSLNQEPETIGDGIAIWMLEMIFSRVRKCGVLLLDVEKYQTYKVKVALHPNIPTNFSNR